ncbi:hypothetical protein J7E68_18665 [Microbacterium sp. ISL-103]|uniref:hypothetical protein n=1 Tax=Microbacterium sp. ISL-103 TaxID=2819156 RepID=UPI001BEB5C1A|nr:hypothetical protein [Microbacterium sp. ISL-103]MBT2476546.1 hypothetical protein [Microbacterium sp. ISL-103]
MTDPPLPPSGAVPPVPPAPPTYAPAPPAPPTYAPAPPAPQAGAPAYPAAPPGAYQVPVGGYAAPAGSYQAPTQEEKKSGLLGVLALVLSLVAAVVTPIVAGVSGFEIGRRIPGGLDATDSDFLSVLSPARDQVLWAELSFWTGTALGIAAIVIGILAIRKKQARGAGIAALVVAVLGPVFFWVVLLVALSTGTAAGFLP